MSFSMRNWTHMSRGVRAATPRAAPYARLSPAFRAYSSPSKMSAEEASNKKGSSNIPLLVTVLIASAAAGAVAFNDNFRHKVLAESPKQSLPTREDYQKVYNAIAKQLHGEEAYDGGNHAPVLVRLAWHASGTYNKDDNTGGSNGATMRFKPEASHGANAGLHNARTFLEPYKDAFPWISYSDLWTLAGVMAVAEMGGPKVPWRPGRVDKSVEATPPEGRLPDGDEDRDRLRKIFYRMGFNDQEIVALSGAHAVGRCHPQYSGFDGPWTHTPFMFTNQFYAMLQDVDWVPKEWSGPFQYVDKESKSLMMLPTDYLLVKDPAFNRWVKVYAESEEKFFSDFAKVFSRLLELGVPKENFEKAAKGLDSSEPIIFKTLDEQGLLDDE